MVVGGLHGWLPCASAADCGAVRALANRLLTDLACSLTALLGRWWPARLTYERAGAQPVASSRARPRYFVLFKPYMVLCSWEADGSKNGRAPRTTLADLGLPSGVHNVGRLDRDSEGLLLLTDDGRFTHELLQEHRHPKRYWVLVRGTPGDEALHAMARDPNPNPHPHPHPNPMPNPHPHPHPHPHPRPHPSPNLNPNPNPNPNPNQARGGMHIRGRRTRPCSVRRITHTVAASITYGCSLHYIRSQPPLHTVAASPL